LSPINCHRSFVTDQLSPLFYHQSFANGHSGSATK